MEENSQGWAPVPKKETARARTREFKKEAAVKRKGGKLKRSGRKESGRR